MIKLFIISFLVCESEEYDKKYKRTKKNNIKGKNKEKVMNKKRII